MASSVRYMKDGNTCWTFKYTGGMECVSQTPAGLACTCDQYRRKDRCWHIDRVWAALEHHRMMVAKAKLRKGKTVFDQMAEDRIEIYRRLEQRRLEYESRTATEAY